MTGEAERPSGHVSSKEEKYGFGAAHAASTGCDLDAQEEGGETADEAGGNADDRGG